MARSPEYIQFSLGFVTETPRGFSKPPGDLEPPHAFRKTCMMFLETLEHQGSFAGGRGASCEQTLHHRVVRGENLKLGRRLHIG